jgi:DNA-directed RNA polymerase specialized sigma24 family protein
VSMESNGGTLRPVRPGGQVGHDVSERERRAATLDELRALYEPLRRYAAVVGRWDVEPDDLVQEAFTKVLAVPEGNVRDARAYLRRTILNLATNERRRLRRATAALQRAGGSGAEGTDAYPSELADLMRLEPRVRGLLYLVEVEGEPIAAAAEAVGMDAAAARMALSRARRRLRADIDEEMHGD